MKWMFTIATSLVAFGFLAACASKPAVTEEQNVSVAPQMPSPAVTEAPTTTVEPTPVAQEQKQAPSKKATRKKSKKK